MGTKPRFSFSGWLADNYDSTDMMVETEFYDAWCRWLETTAQRLPDPVDRDIVRGQVRQQKSRLAASHLVEAGIPQEEVTNAFMLIYHEREPYRRR